MADYGYLSLTLGSFNTLIDTFNIDSGFPRIPGEFPSPEFSATRALISPGNPYGIGDRWEFEGILSKTNALNLKNLYREHRRLIDNRQDGKILLIDTILEIEEISPRTRAKAPTPFDTEISSGGYISFFGQFYVAFATPPEFKPEGVIDGNLTWAVNCSLIELGLKP